MIDRRAALALVLLVLAAPLCAQDQTTPGAREKDRQFWSFQKLARPPVPRVRHAERVRTPIDAFVLVQLEPNGLTLAPDAERATLLRRAGLDLTGLPPSPE